MKIAFQGTKGAYSEQAIYRLFGNEAQAIGLMHSHEVCASLKNDEVDMAILPLENSIVGNVNINIDLIYKEDFYAINEVYLPIKHCLLAPKGKTLRDIKFVHSHPIALEQCQDFLNKNNLTAIPDYDTAGAAKNIANDSTGDQATISSPLCAKYYNLDILDDNVQNVSNNFTRFLVFVKNKNVVKNQHANKMSIAFITKHNPGSLLNCLQIFADHGINLTQLQSRPIPEDPFVYTFFVDFLEHHNRLQTKKCLEALGLEAKKVKIIGRYPGAFINED